MISLKLYRPEATTHSVSTVFAATIVPRLTSGRRAATTIEDYGRAVRAWEAVTGDPGISQIDEQTLDQFTAAMSDKGLSARTVNKYTTYLQTILDACGPDRQGRRSCHGRKLQLIERVPLFQLLEEDEPAVRACPSIAEVVAMQQHVQAAAVPSSESAHRLPRRQSALKWSMALAILDWCGPRRTDLFRNLRVSHWVPDERCPLETIDLRWPWGWLVYVPEKTKRTKKRPHCVPLSPEIASGLRQIIRPAATPDPPLLGFAPYGQVQWYAELHKIQTAAGLNKTYAFHALRKRCNITWDETCGIGTGGLFLCHAAKGVNAQSYSEATALMLRAAQKRLTAEGVT